MTENNKTEKYLIYNLNSLNIVMAHYVRERERICEVGTIVSSGTEEITAPDGSRHNVPLINCNALQYLRQNYEDNENENNLSGKSERLVIYANDQQEKKWIR